MNRQARVHVWRPAEMVLHAEKTYDKPYLDVTVSAEFRGPAGERLVVPGFWDGADIADIDRASVRAPGDVWKVRFAPPSAGRWEWHTASSDPDDGELHGQSGVLEVAPYEGANPIHAHGFLGVSANRRGFVHRDGTPFFWLGDTTVSWRLVHRGGRRWWSISLRCVR